MLVTRGSNTVINVHVQVLLVSFKTAPLLRGLLEEIAVSSVAPSNDSPDIEPLFVEVVPLSRSHLLASINVSNV